MKQLISTFLLSALLATAATVNYTYDTAGRLIKVDYGAGGSITYTYDKAGNLLSKTVSSVPPQAKKKPAAK